MYRLKGGRTSGRLLPECEGRPECQKPEDCTPLRKKMNMYLTGPLKSRYPEAKREYDECVAKERESLNCPAECFESKGLSKGKKDALKFMEGLNQVTSTATAGILAVGEPALAAAASSVGGPAAGMAVNEVYNQMVEKPGYTDKLKEKSVFGNDEKVWDVVDRVGKEAVKVGEKTAARTDQIDPEKEAKDLLDKGLEKGKQEGKKQLDRGRRRLETEGQRLVDRGLQEGQQQLDSGLSRIEDEVTRRTGQLQSTVDDYTDQAYRAADVFTSQAQESLNEATRSAQGYADAMSNFETYYTADGYPYYYNTLTGVSQWEKPTLGGYQLRSGNRFAG